MAAYYNENDPNAAKWLRNLIAAGLIAPGVVDERSILDVSAADLEGFTQCHFFAGIGGWSYALRLAGWSDDREVWTGSCPCQPFSNAGKQKGTADERHLWPEFQRLIAERFPAVVFGEQVASKAGRHWLSGVRSDLEALGYGVGAADLCAAGVGAPHIRQRLWWVAEPAGERLQNIVGGSSKVSEPHRQRASAVLGRPSILGGLGNAHDAGSQGWGALPERAGERSPWTASMDCWIPCGDGKARRIEPGIEPLAYGVSARVASLRGYGNAIVPQVAEVFIRAYADCATAGGDVQRHGPSAP